MSVPDVPEYLPDPGTHPPADPAALRAVGLLIYDLARDPRVPWTAKAAALGAGLYAAPGLRRVFPRSTKMVAVDALLVLAALRHLVAAAGYEVVRERWTGDDAGFAWLLVLSGIDA